MLKVGLTGGIGSGKSTVALLFAEYGVPIIDADETARRMVNKGQPALAQLVTSFGEEILDNNGALNRNKLRNQIYLDPAAKAKLEKILHPLIYADMQQSIDRLDHTYCIVSVPLLLETGMRHFVNRILIVDCSVEIQIQRVKHRDQFNDELINRIIGSQISRQARLAQADDVIDNSGNGEELAEQVKKLHNFYHLTAAALR